VDRTLFVFVFVNMEERAAGSRNIEKRSKSIAPSKSKREESYLSSLRCLASPAEAEGNKSARPFLS
jgi:hypothetical protein